MQRNNSQFGGYKQIGTGNQRNFGGQPQQQQMGYPDQQEDEVVEWLNIMVTGTNGERKKLGNGIPLRESKPLERAILNMLYDPETGLRYEEIDLSRLLGAIVLECRPAGRVDDVFDIAFGGDDKPAPTKQVARSKANAEQEAAELLDASTDALEPEPRKPRTTGRRLGAK